MFIKPNAEWSNFRKRSYWQVKMFGRLQNLPILKYWYFFRTENFPREIWTTAINWTLLERLSWLLLSRASLTFSISLHFAGNSLVCLAFHRNPSLRTVTNYFVLSLALTDLSMALFVMQWSKGVTLPMEWRRRRWQECRPLSCLDFVSAGCRHLLVTFY